MFGRGKGSDADRVKQGFSFLHHIVLVRLSDMCAQPLVRCFLLLIRSKHQRLAPPPELGVSLPTGPPHQVPPPQFGHPNSCPRRTCSIGAFLLQMSRPARCKGAPHFRIHFLAQPAGHLSLISKNASSSHERSVFELLMFYRVMTTALFTLAVLFSR